MKPEWGGFKRMKKLIFLVLGVLLFCSFGTHARAQIKIGQKAPDIVTSTMDGKRFVLQEYMEQPENEILILTFFTTWCDCREEFQFLKRLEAQYGHEGLRIFCVYTGRQSKLKEAQKYLESLDVQFPILLDKKGAVSKSYKVTGLPCNYAIDREGVLRFRCLGCSEDVKRKFEANLKNLLGGPDKKPGSGK
jgi:peroxiredoxin